MTRAQASAPSRHKQRRRNGRLLHIEDLSHRRGQGGQAFRVEVPKLALAPGEIIAITGESGCGKSTALELLGLVARPLAVGRFEARFGDGGPVDVGALWRADELGFLARLRARHLGFVLQTGGLLPYLRVAGNIQVNRRLLGLPAEDGEVRTIVHKLEIADLLHKKPHQLSVGQQQRVSVARALAHRPRLLLADEPTASLDPRLGDEVMGLLLDLADRFGIGVVIATHSQAQVEARGLRQLRAEPLTDGFGSRFV